MMEIYLDGVCLGSSGPGGWAAVLVTENGRAVLKGSAKDTTDDRVKLIAAMEALSVAYKDSEVRLFSDSEYLIKTMTEGLERTKDLDLWKRIDRALKRCKVEWILVKDIDESPENKNANEIARSMIP